MEQEKFDRFGRIHLLLLLSLFLYVLSFTWNTSFFHIYAWHDHLSFFHIHTYLLLMELLMGYFFFVFLELLLLGLPRAASSFFIFIFRTSSFKSCCTSSFTRCNFFFWFTGTQTYEVLNLNRSVEFASVNRFVDDIYLIDVNNDANNEKMYQHCLARGKTSSQSSSMKRLQWNSRFKLNKSFTYVYNYLH